LAGINLVYKCVNHYLLITLEMEYCETFLHQRVLWTSNKKFTYFLKFPCNMTKQTRIKATVSARSVR